MAERNHTVDALRAIAALSVCLFHFQSGAGVGAYGYLGVTIFFVISGFIVPYSMLRAGYTLAAWPTFMARRLVRLEPPYLASVVLILALGAWDALRGTPPTWTAAQIAGHLGYANAFLGLPWLNAAYWTLAVELQFYVLMGVALPLLRLAGAPGKRLVGVALAACLPLALPAQSNATILPFLPIFAAGTLCFLRAAGMIGGRSFWAALAVVGAILLATKDEPGVALATVGTAILIATVRVPRVAPVAWLGTVSYSLYLLHVPVGYRVMSAIPRSAETGRATVTAIVAALAASIAAAALLHRAVERPALRLAARLGYRPARADAPAAGDAPMSAAS